MAVVTVATTKCGKPEYRYDIRRKEYVAVCDCGMRRTYGVEHHAKDDLKAHNGGWRILTWLS